MSTKAVVFLLCTERGHVTAKKAQQLQKNGHTQSTSISLAIH